jgi:hypothetical protein
MVIALDLHWHRSQTLPQLQPLLPTVLYQRR